MAGHPALCRRHLFRQVRDRTAAASHACRADRSAGAGHSLQGVAAGRRSRGDQAVDARLPHPGARANRDQRATTSFRSRRRTRPPGSSASALPKAASSPRSKYPSKRYALVAYAPAHQHRSRQSRLDRPLRSRIPGRPARARERVALWNVVAGSSQIVTEAARSRCRRIATTTTSMASSIPAARTTTRMQGRGPTRRRRERRSACRRISAR